jgi:hypothetical protein
MIRRFLDLVLSALGAAVLVVAVLILGPEIETRVNPVYSKFTILSIVGQPDGTSKVVFRYRKERQCDPQGFSWYVGEPGAAFRQLKVTPADPSEATPVRPIGENTSVPYVIDATPEQLIERGYGEIFNRCHAAWTSRTIIYP